MLKNVFLLVGLFPVCWVFFIFFYLFFLSKVTCFLIKTKQNGFNDVTLTNCLVTSAGYHLKKVDETNTPRKRPWVNFNLGDFGRNEATLLYIYAFPVGLSVDLPLACRPTRYLAGRLAV